MGRPHIEFVQITDRVPVRLGHGAFAGAQRSLLSEDVETGAWTGLLGLQPGWEGDLGGLGRPVEFFVLRGLLAIAGRQLAAGEYCYAPASQAASLAADDDVVVLVMVEPPDEGDGPIEFVDTSTVRYLPSGRHVDIPPGIVNKRLRVDPSTGDETWLAAVVPEWMESRAEIHPTVEECFMIRGDILLGGRGAMGPGSYFWRPPMVRHGPMYSRTGGLFFFRSKGGRLGVDYEEVAGWEEIVDAYARGEPYFGVASNTRFQPLVDELHTLTASSRVTLRMNDGRGCFPVVAEALSPGVRSIVDDAEIDLRSAPTFRYLERELRPLVQEDILTSDIAPPPELVERYGARAQILAPIVRDGRMVGFVSVHHAHGPRRWSDDEIGAAEAAARRAATSGPER
jgi:hypothetical protein